MTTAQYLYDDSMIYKSQSRLQCTVIRCKLLGRNREETLSAHFISSNDGSLFCEFFCDLELSFVIFLQICCAYWNSVHFVYFLKGFVILFATIAGSLCAEPVNVEVNSQQTVKEAQPQKRAVGFSDCDGPLGVVGLSGGFHGDVGVHGDLALGLHGHGYAPAYSGGYASSYGGGYLAHGGLLSHVGSVGVGSVGHLSSVGSLAHVGSVGAIVGSSPFISAGYAPHAPVLSSSVVSSPIISHAPILAHPPVCYFE